MSDHRKFLLDDTVKYIGKGRNIARKANAWGRIVGYVQMSKPFEYVVEFGDGSYVVSENNLEYHRASNKDDFTVEVQRISRKWDEE